MTQLQWVRGRYEAATRGAKQVQGSYKRCEVGIR